MTLDVARCFGMVGCLVACAAGALAGAADGNLVVTVPGVLPGETPRDLEIELARRGGVIQTQGWIMQQFSYGVGAVHVEEQKEVEEGTALKVAVRIRKDCWRPEVEGVLRMTLAGTGGVAQVVGTMTVEGKESAVQATARFASAPAWPEPVGPTVQGHPRLILRPGDLSVMKERLATPEGAPILEQLRQGAALRYVKSGGSDSKFRTWPAVACGMLYHLTGESMWATQAQAVVEASLKDDGGQDIHMAPRLCGMALAYDLLAGVWADAFRQRVAADLRRRIGQLDLMGGFPKAASLASGSNHNGIRLASLGVAALALLGDGPDADMERLLADVQRRIRHHLEVGYGETGMCVEGRFYKSMTLGRSLGPFLWSHRQALGGRVEGNGLTDWYWLGDEVLAAQPGHLNAQPTLNTKDGSSPASIALVLGGVSVRGDHLPVLRWLLDRYLAEPVPTTRVVPGEGHHLMSAIYLPVAFPWDVAPRSPAEVLPAVLLDRRYGRCVLRPAYGAAFDPVLVLNPKTGLIRQGHERGGWNGGVQLFVPGGSRLDGSWLPVVAGMAKAGNPTLGGVMKSMRQEGERRLALEIDLDRAFLQNPRDAEQTALKDKAAKPADTEEDTEEEEEVTGRELAEKLLPELGGKAVVDVPGWGFWIDYGVRGRRAIAADATEGGPLLIAIRDRVWIEGGDPAPVLHLDVPLAQRSVAPVSDGARFTVGAAPGVLAGMVVGPEAKAVTSSTSRAVLVMEKGKAPKPVMEHTWTLTLGGRGVMLTVLALGAETAPAIVAEGETVMVGARRLKVDGDRIAWE